MDPDPNFLSVRPSNRTDILQKSHTLIRFFHIITEYSTKYQIFVLKPTNKMEAQMDSMTQADFDELKFAYQGALPAIGALKQQLKSLNKEQKSRMDQIHSYMRENNIMSADIGGLTIEREEKTTVSVSMKTLEEVIDNPADLEQYKRDHTTTKEVIKVRKPKRQRTSDE